MEQALQEVVPSKQCIWKSCLFAVEFSGHKFDLQQQRDSLHEVKEAWTAERTQLITLNTRYDYSQSHLKLLQPFFF